LVIGILGICACLGYYARRRAGWKTLDTSSSHQTSFI
jgi:hypothetical protein